MIKHFTLEKNLSILSKFIKTKYLKSISHKLSICDDRNKDF